MLQFVLFSSHCTGKQQQLPVLQEQYLLAPILTQFYNGLSRNYTAQWDFFQYMWSKDIGGSCSWNPIICAESAKNGPKE